MLTKTIKLLSVLLFIGLTTQLSLAQQQNQQASGNAPPQPQYVDFTGFKGKVLEVKNRDPRSLVSLLSPLGSGFKGAELRPNTEFKTITVRDFPENIAAIEEALKRLDVPLPVSPKSAATPLPNAEMRLHVLLASNDETGKPETYPAEIQKVVKELQSTLSYKNYVPVTIVVHRGIISAVPANSGGRVRGLAIVGNPLFTREVTLPYEMTFERIEPESKIEDNGRIYIRNFNFDIGGGNDLNYTGNSRVSTTLTLREGEQVVVGTSSLKDKGLVLIMSIKVIK
ncbi:MAG: secretin N-terminal domain-containing protein [Blastocatellales bacterium]